MRDASPLSVGLDGPNEAIAVAYAREARDAAGVCWGRLGTRQRDIDTLLRTLTANAPPRVFVDDAGPWGSWRSRARRRKQRRCWVVAPALVPKPAGARVKTDRRDATPLARLMRSGELPPIDVPTAEDEALRDRTRARAEALRDRQAATPRLQAFRLRQDRRDAGRATWGPAPRRGLAAVGWPTHAQQIVFQAYVRAVAAHEARRQRLETALREPVQGWRLAPVVQARQAMRGVQCTVAVTRLAARGDRTRFETPRQRLSSLGLTPRESSPGARHRQGAITTAGHTFARRALIEGAWASRYPATSSRHLQGRWATGPQASQTMGWNAQGRLYTRFRHRTARGKPAPPVVVASARDMAAFTWAITRDVPIARGTRLGGTRRPVDGRPPRCGAILAGVQRRQETRAPRARQAPDGRQSGGRHPTAIRVLTRRDDWLLLGHCSGATSAYDHDKRPSTRLPTTSPLTADVIATPAMSRAWKRERGTSGRCKASAPVRG
jgi:transposase